MFGLSTVYSYLLAGVGAFALVAGAYLYGHHEGALESKVAIAQFDTSAQKQQVVYQQIAGPATTKIVTQYVDRWHTITENATSNQTIAETIVPDHLELSKGWLATHNAAVSADKVSDDLAKDATPSGVSANDALAVIVDNYGQCSKTQAQLNAVLDAIDASNAAIDAANKSTKN